MKLNRRTLLKTLALSAAGSVGGGLAKAGEPAASEPAQTGFADLDEALDEPVLDRSLFPDPLIIEQLELREHRGNYLCVVRTKDGAEGMSISNNAKMRSLYPIFTERLQPFFPGKDARDLENLLEEVYVYRSNYKFQGLPLWVPLATIEFAILDLLGQVAGKPLGALLGKVRHPKVAVYRANNFRGKSAGESLERIRERVEEMGAKALKFKVGGRMSREEEPPGRSEKLIPLIREAFGPDMTIYADSNGSYDTAEAIRIGKLMEAQHFDFYEEPVPFDWYEETRAVAEALEIPIAGGEQEPSLRNFRRLIGNGALQVVQPDLFYFGGMIRSLRVARMAARRGLSCVPHISGSGLGYLYMMHFVSALPNAGPFHEFKGFHKNIPLECPTSDLQSHNGEVTVPTGPGLGVEVDPGFVKKHKKV